ncbi:hypothetical protein MLD38_003285 [Melastoma candidum]|uniref:Uncharacterized protein n=1 Tax=Melastoma candidum TaxID=119954 RepID=A0ACB9S6L6_9MYRT|nr:hypothetical protein MLD38_003285 [Melastoma candidum]
MQLELKLLVRLLVCKRKPVVAVRGIAGIALSFRYNDERRVIRKGEGDTPVAISAKGPIIGCPFTLTDTKNQVVTEKDLLGNWLLSYFGYTSCPDVGPEQLRTMAKALDVIGDKQKSRILPVFVTIDPQRDKPSHLRAYLRVEFDPGIIGLIGPVNAVRQMVQEYRVYFKKMEEEGEDYLVDSSDNMYLLNPDMEIVSVWDGVHRRATRGNNPHRNDKNQQELR